MDHAVHYLPIYSLHDSVIYFEEESYQVHPLGLVYSHRTEGMGWFRDLIARVWDFFGGNVGTYNRSVHRRLIKPALQELSDMACELYRDARRGPPDAIVGFTMSVQPMGAKGMSMMKVTMYGTAVRLKKLGVVSPLREVVWETQASRTM